MDLFDFYKPNFPRFLRLFSRLISTRFRKTLNKMLSVKTSRFLYFPTFSLLLWIDFEPSTFLRYKATQHKLHDVEGWKCCVVFYSLDVKTLVKILSVLFFKLSENFINFFFFDKKKKFKPKSGLGLFIFTGTRNILSYLAYCLIPAIRHYLRREF